MFNPQKYIEPAWEKDVMPALSAYMEIPCVSPSFDAGWAQSGHIDNAAELLADWARAQLADIEGATVEVLRIGDRTPTIYLDMPGNGHGTALIYGHFDKQPPMSGWLPGRSAWTPTLEGDRLYGRRGADDGYALFSAILAVRAARAAGVAMPRCVVLIEGCEESGSYDLPAYVDRIAPGLGEPDLIVALDANCGNYDQLWTTTSVRGQVAGTLTVRVLTAGVHSGDASGAIPSSFRIVRQLLSRLEDPDTGEIIPSAFHAPIPDERRAQAAIAADLIGPALFDNHPTTAGLLPVTDRMAELALNCSWRPQLAITGFDGLPGVADAAAVMVPSTSLKVSLRLPPTVDPDLAAEALKELFERDPPYRSEVSFSVEMVSQGWSAPATEAWVEESLMAASMAEFGSGAASLGGGGEIPFLSMLGERFQNAQFITTGVLGPGSNAHGPNEFLHLPTVKRVTAVLSRCLADLSNHARPRPKS